MGFKYLLILALILLNNKFILSYDDSDNLLLKEIRSPNKKVHYILIISNMNTGPSKENIQSKKEMLYDTLNDSKINCEINVVSLDAIKQFTELSLSFYDCIIYDLLDYGCGIQNPSGVIINYIKNGGNILVTHDHVYFGLTDILGLKLKGPPSNFYKEAINTSFGHEIWKSYYHLEDLKVMKVNTHNVCIISNEETKQLMHSNDIYNDLYLSARDLGNGKAVFWNAGHSPDLTEDEKKLFLNIMAWILK